MTHSEQINEIAAALSKAQGEMEPAEKDATNPAYRSKYATLAAVMEAARKPLAKHGLSALQDVIITEFGVAVTTRLLHQTGQWIEFGPLTVPLAKQDAHGVGSAASYGKRYGLSAALGIVAEDDDDGNAAVDHAGPAKSDAPAGTIETVTGKVVNIVQRPAGNGTKYVVTLDNRQSYSTLKKLLAEQAKAAQEAAAQVEITFKATKWGHDLMTLRDLSLPEPESF